MMRASVPTCPSPQNEAAERLARHRLEAKKEVESGECERGVGCLGPAKRLRRDVTSARPRRLLLAIPWTALPSPRGPLLLALVEREVRGLYQGFGAATIGGAPATCLYLTSYDLTVAA